MKKQIISLVIAFLAMYSSAYGQQDAGDPTSNISVVAQYKAEDNSVELRFFADKKSVLENGMQYGYTIERAEINSIISKQEDVKYQQIATVKPFTDAQWEEAKQTTDDKLKKQLEVAHSFYKEGITTLKTTTSPIDLKTLIDKKNAEDFQFALLLMSAIQNPKIALALGLAYDDKTAKPNIKYVYKASLTNYKGPYAIVDVPYLITTNEQSEFAQRAIEVNVGDTELGFSWEENDMVSGVMVERKNEVTGKYEALNDKPKYSLSENSLRNGFGDSGLENYKLYQYRFYGFNGFGEKILFGEVKAMPKDLTPPKKPLMQSAEHTKPDEVTITWTMPTPDADLKGFTVKHSTEVDGEFKELHEQLLDKSARTYSDTSFIRGGKNYYAVQAIDTAGNKSVSFSAYVTLMDTIAPNTPKFLSSKIDSLGVVTLKLEPNKEKDLMGYRLFMANSPDHEFSAIQEGFDSDIDNTKSVKHMFNDTITLKSLSPYVYYKAKALDHHHNQSNFSEILKVKRIDTIPPTTPVFKNAIVGETSIELHFELSESSDVKTQILYRKTDLNGLWEIVSELEENQTVYTDKELKKKTKYFYSLRAMDESNLFSDYSMSISGTPYDNGKRETVQNFSIRKNDNQYLLSWNYRVTKDTYFIIFKSNTDGKLVQYKRTEKLNFTEKETKTKQSYAIRAYTKDGGSSKMSTIISASL